MAHTMNEHELTALEKDLVSRMNGTVEYDSVENHDFLCRAVVRLLSDNRALRRELLKREPHPRVLVVPIRRAA